MPFLAHIESWTSLLSWVFGATADPFVSRAVIGGLWSFGIFLVHLWFLGDFGKS